MLDEGRRSRGRPRDPSIDTRVLGAVQELLVAKGFDATTVQAVSARSGVPVSAIYRRWATRADVIEEAVFPGLEPIDVLATGDLERDLRRLIRSFAAVLGRPVARAAMPGLLASYQSNGRSGAPAAWGAVSLRPQFLDIIRHAPAGQVRTDVDLEDVFDMLIGALVSRTIIPTVAERNRPVERLVELTLRLLESEPR